MTDENKKSETELKFEPDSRFDSIVEDMEKFAEEAAGEVNEAVNDFSSAVGDAIDEVAEDVKSKVEEHETKREGGKINLEKIMGYIPILAGAIGFLWIIPFIFEIVIRILNRIYYFSYGMLRPLGTFIRIFAWFRGFFIWIILILAIVAIAGLVYMMLTERKDSDKQMLYVGIACAAAVLLACIFSRSHAPSALTFIFALAGLILGIDLAMNVFIEKKNLHGKFQLSDDIALLGGMIGKQEKVDKAQYTDANIPKYEETEEIESLDSYFDGKGSELFVKNLLLALLSMVTCGIAAPFMLVDILKWKKDHTVIEGRRLQFNGTAGQLFGLWIKWWLLSIVTCGIYTIFARADYMKWITRHTSYLGEIENPEGFYSNSRFEGAAPEVLGYSMVTSIITSATCGLAYPWAVGMQKKWEAKNTIVSSDRLFYDGKGGSLFGTYLINMILTGITCGIYGAWATCRLERYFINHTHVDATSRR